MSLGTSYRATFWVALVDASALRDYSCSKIVLKDPFFYRLVLCWGFSSWIHKSFGKRLTDSMFENGLNLNKFAMKAAFNENVMEIVDSNIVKDDENEVIVNRRRSSQANADVTECLSRMAEIGVVCSMDSPSDRMEMSLAVKKLVKVREAFQKISNAMPYYRMVVPF